MNRVNQWVKSMVARWGVWASVLAVILVAGFLFSPASAALPAQSTPPASPVQAVVVVERAIVFPSPDRLAAPLTYLYERERVPVLGQTADSVWLLTQVERSQGWILRAQVELEGDPAQIPVINAPASSPTLTMTPFALSTVQPGVTAGAPPTRTPLPTRTPAPAISVTPAGSGTTPTDATSEPSGVMGDLAVLPGAPPPITLDLPEDWNSVDLIVPYRTFDDASVRDVPLTIYFGPLPDGSQGFIYLYWGFPGTIDLSTGQYNLWADGAQILRFSLISSGCNLGVYDQRAFPVGDQEGIGAFYQAAECPDEPDTAGWFSVLRMYNGGFAFFVAVEPPDALPTQNTFIQDILNTVEFMPPETS